MDPAALKSLAAGLGLITPESPAVQVVVSVDCPRNHVLVMDPADAEVPVIGKGQKVVVCPTPKVAASVSAAVEGAGLELVG